jgi:hypothetical protein
MSAPDDTVNDPAEQARQRRAAARAGWPVRRFALGQEPADDLSRTTTAAERIAMVWRLTLDAWAMTGRPLPEYTREQMPGRVIRPSDQTHRSDTLDD